MHASSPLQVPLCLPLDERVDWAEVQRGIEHPSVPGMDEDDWSRAEDVQRSVTCSLSFFQPLHGKEHDGDTCFAVGFSDGSVEVYAQRMRAEEAAYAPPSPASSSAHVSVRGHLRNSPKTWGHTNSEPLRASLRDSSIAIGTPHPSIAPTSPAHVGSQEPRSYAHPPAEQVLEQLQAGHAHVIEHPRSEAHTEKPHAKHELHLHSVPQCTEQEHTTQNESAAFSEPLAYACDGQVRKVRSLYGPDASPVLALVLDTQRSEGAITDYADNAMAPKDALLLVQQASGRITVWSLPLLEFQATTIVRIAQLPGAKGAHQVRFTFAREQHAGDAQSVLASLPAAEHTQFHVYPLPVHAHDTQVLIPSLVWVEFPAWPSKLFVLRIDVAYGTLVLCAVLDAPHGPRSVHLTASDTFSLAVHTVHQGALQCTPYAIPDWTQFRRGAAPQAAAMRDSQSHMESTFLALLGKAHDGDAAPPVACARGHYALAAILMLSTTCVLAFQSTDAACLLLVDSAEQPIRHLLPSSFVSMHVLDAPRTLGVVCKDHICTLRAGTLHTAQRTPAEILPVYDRLLQEPLQSLSFSCAPSPTAILPLSLSRILVAERNGLYAASLLDLFHGTPHEASNDTRPVWDANVILLQQLANPRTGTRHIFGGSDAGDLVLWNFQTLRVEATWSWFASPLQCIVPLQGVNNLSRLYDCVLCVAQDGTTAILALDDLRLVQMIPGCGAPLMGAAVKGNELLLHYEGRARIWSMETHELVRSVHAEQIEMLLSPSKGEHWIQFSVPRAPRSASYKQEKAGMLSICGAAAQGAVPVLYANVRRAMDTACKSLRGALGAGAFSSALDAYKLGASAAPLASSDSAADKLLNTFVPILRIFLPVHLDGVFGKLGTALFGSAPPPLALIPVVARGSFVGVKQGKDAGDVAQRFSFTPVTTAEHMLAIVAFLLLLHMIEHLQPLCKPALHGLLTPDFMARCTQPHAFQRPCLTTVCRYMLDENEVLRTSASLVFEHYVKSTSREELAEAMATWAAFLEGHEEPGTPHALLLLGLLAPVRYVYFSPLLLKRIAVMIMRYLTTPIVDATTTWHAYIALELCCRGCDIWQHYLDAVTLVRSIFAMATGPDDEMRFLTLSGLPLRGLARRATLALATRQSTLFMSTLAMDILHPPSLEHGQVTLRLVAFMIRQKPLVLYPSLPRLVEAVVKSLDPTVASMRSSMVKSATLMLNELVKTYPSIAFHGPMQRLAVGTHDGPVVLYDLKTATRLYILGGHSTPVTACSFSPDGRRLLSMSLESEVVLIWRLSTGFLDIFVPGAISRLARSHDPAEADRAVHFHLGDAALLAPAQTLTQVSFEWRNSQSVLLRVGEASVTLGIV
ncbi:hypothetical protein MVES1_001576 [Malassezia vespertilionis]|uniref:Uncharacterized protein n=1 Tax=Malassezia vespertilionis TaxID=2020962 RepID=A0A2N1JD84_9BASI|nr:uncharacterized protein MVES1_001576 [Malassezia vespertilionis]PKI84489.1 hypothetical protein MVES_001485 [Malassezia vespertilionis]WFD06233.1 hypothetical protein MVES1_001576 [Malassezia vespertilionis]